MLLLSLLALVIMQTGASSQQQEHPSKREECDSTPEICATMAAFGGSLVVPQVIPMFKPVGALHLYYDDHKIDVGGAQQLPPARVAKQPYVAFNLTDPPKTGPPYILFLIDPDAAAIRGSQACALHWMLTDIFFDENTKMMRSGFISAPYNRPNPPEGPLHHRYVALLYEQPPLFLPPVFSAGMHGARLHFNLPMFLRDYGLRQPVGGQFFKTYWDGKPLPQDSEPAQPKQTQAMIKTQSSPILAGVIGSVLGLLYGAGS